MIKKKKVMLKIFNHKREILGKFSVKNEIYEQFKIFKIYQENFQSKIKFCKKIKNEIFQKI